MKGLLTVLGGVAGLFCGPAIAALLYRETFWLGIIQGAPGDGALALTIILSGLLGILGFLIVYAEVDD